MCPPLAIWAMTYLFVITPVNFPRSYICKFAFYLGAVPLCGRACSTSYQVELKIPLKCMEYVGARGVRFVGVFLTYLPLLSPCGVPIAPSVFRDPILSYASNGAHANIPQYDGRFVICPKFSFHMRCAHMECVPACAEARSLGFIRNARAGNASLRARCRKFRFYTHCARGACAPACAET